MKSEIRLTRKGKALAGVLMLTAGVATANALQRSDDAIINKDRATAVDTASAVLGRVVVLKAGANYRLSPDVEDTADGAPNNLVASVPSGQELVVKLPLVSTPPTEGTADRPGWIGFTLPGTDTSKIHSKTDRAQATVWADLPALEAQKLAIEFPYPDYPSGGNTSTTVPASVTSDGSIVITGVDGAQSQPSSVTSTNTLAVSAFEQAGGYEQLRAEGISTAP